MLRPRVVGLNEPDQFSLTVAQIAHKVRLSHVAAHPCATLTELDFLRVAVCIKRRQRFRRHRR